MIHHAAVGVVQAECDKAGDDDDQRNSHLEGGADDRSHLCCAQIIRTQYALDYEEVGRPIAEADDEAETEDNTGPVHTHGVITEVAQRGPEVRVAGVMDVVGDIDLQVAPAASLDQAKQRNHRGAGPDEHKLQHFVDDCRPQTAQHDIQRDRTGANPDGEVDVPAEHGLHHDRHGVHVHAAHQDGHERKRDRAQCSCALTKAQVQVARHRVGLRDVVEGHHDDAEEQHRRDRADPVPVRRQHAVLVGRAGPTHQFQ